jgi:hypothetical protein
MNTMTAKNLQQVSVQSLIVKGVVKLFTYSFLMLMQSYYFLRECFHFLLFL